MMQKDSRTNAATAPFVSVAHGLGGYDNARVALERLSLSGLSRKRVLLKPNVGRIAAIGAGVTTHPSVVAAAIDLFRELGADVAVGESPIVGVDVHDAFDATGIAAVADERACPLIDLDERPAVEIALPEGRILHSIQVCPDVLEFDYVVSIPVMKMHMHTGATLSVKNMKGCLWRRSKTQLHMLPPIEGSDQKSIDVAIADMASVLRADLALIDGTVGMEGLGPSAGEPKPLDAVVVSTDPFAADAVACQLMGTTADNVAHLRIGAKRGYGIIDLKRLRVSPDNWRDCASDFAPPPRNLTIEFPGITIWDNNSCSACQSTVLLFLKKYGGQLVDYFHDAELNVAIGKGNTHLPEKTLCVGNCTARHRDRGIFVPGCPPVGSQVMDAIAKEAELAQEADNESSTSAN